VLWLADAECSRCVSVQLLVAVRFALCYVDVPRCAGVAGPALSCVRRSMVRQWASCMVNADESQCAASVHVRWTVCDGEE
jgi:hypothetical protein